MMITSSPATKAIGSCALVALAVTALLGLVVSPPDQIQGEAVRLMYVHVPSIWTAYLAFAVTAVCSVLWLWPRTRHPRFDRLAGASAEIGVLFTGLCLLTGMMWGRITWGVFWQWDARLTTTLLLFLLYLGYLAIRRIPADPQVRARRSAIGALVAAIDIPVVHFSVVWWRTLHQEASLARPDLDFQIEGEMLQALLFALVAFNLIYAWSVLHRTRLARLEDQRDADELEAAIAERSGRLVEVGS